MKVVHKARRMLNGNLMPVCSSDYVRTFNWELRWPDAKKSNEKWCRRCLKATGAVEADNE